MTWPLFADNQPIKSGLAPETGATLQIYNWVAYVNQSCLNSFAKKYNCKVQLTTFNTMNEALSKLRSGLSFDVFMGVTVDVLGQLDRVEAGPAAEPQLHPEHQPGLARLHQPVLRPGLAVHGAVHDLHHGHLVAEGPGPREPVHDAEPLAPMLWQPKYKGKIAILDDYREGISLGLMKNGIYNLNTTDRAPDRPVPAQSLQDLSSLVNVRIDNNDYTEVPTGQTWIHHAWSGRHGRGGLLHAQGRAGRAVGYWFPRDGKGPGGQRHQHGAAQRDQPGARAPVPRTTCKNLPNVLENISFNGYMQPLNEVTPQRLVTEKLLPKSLISTASCRSYFRRGRRRAAAAGGRRRALAAGLARGEQRNLGARDGITRSGGNPHRKEPKQDAHGRGFWIALAAPGMIWLILLFVVPFYVVLAIAMGQLNRLYETPIAVWNPLHWSSSNVINVWHDLVGATSFAGPIVIRTIVYVAIGSLLCLVIGYPAAYFVARFAGRRKGLFLLLLIAPFWISYMMRMLAWIDLLQTDGYVNKALSALGLISQPVNWLGGKPVTVILGLVYGYIPYLILVLFAGLDRIDPALIEAGRDLGLSRARTFLRVTLPLSRQPILTAMLITVLPMIGDYYTNQLMSGAANTSMIGNLIAGQLGTPGLQGQGAVLSMLLLLVLLVPMIYYVVATNRSSREAM